MPNGSTPLSEREQEILRLVATGVTNQEIARRLVISVNTVKVHLRNIFAKISVESRTEATMWAVHQGLVQIKAQEAAAIIPEPDQELLADSTSRRADQSPQPAGEVASTAQESAAAFTPESIPSPQEAPLPAPPEPISLRKRVFLVASAVVVLFLAFAPIALRNSARARTASVNAFSDSTTAADRGSTSASSRWKARAQMPSARSRLAVVAAGRLVYAIGGDSGGQPTSSVEVYDPAQNVWQIRTPKPTAASNIGAVMINGLIYVPGGLTSEGQPVAALEVYDPATDKWVSLAPLPKALCAYAIAALGDQLYIFGGWDGKNYAGDVYIYDSTKDDWKSGTAMAQSRGFTAATALGRRIYLVGGYDGLQEFPNCDEYDPSREGSAQSPWRKCPPLSVGRGGLSLATVGEVLYVVGGGWDNYLAYNERYDPRSNAWVSFESPALGQWRNLGLAAVAGKLYAIGGWDGESLSSNEEYQALYQIVVPARR